MRKSFPLILLIVMSTLPKLTSAGKPPKYHFDKDEDGSKMAVGIISTKLLLSDTAFAWFKEGYNSYHPDKETVKALKEAFGKDNQVIIFGGTWCGDTHELLPKFFKTMKEAGIKESKVTLYAVDRTKTTEDHKAQDYKVTNVPTFIILEDGQEKGRIVESVEKSIEKDLLAILTE